MVHINRLCNYLRLNAGAKFRCYSTSGNKDANYYDIVISGGGMVGFAMACSLGKSKFLSNKKILLVESAERQKIDMTNYGIRVCALNPGSKDLLKSLGVWENIKNNRFGTVKNMQVWDSCSDAAITFGDPASGEDVAYIVENDLILDSLMQEADKLGHNLEIVYKSKVSDCQLPKDGDDYVRIKVGDGLELSTSLLIGADGYNSGVRKSMGSQYISLDYEQMAVVATLKLSEVGENVTAWQRFLPSGPIALLPLNNELSSLVWSTDKQTAKELMRLPSETFVDEVNHAMWNDGNRDTCAENVTKKFTEAFDMFRTGLSAGGFRQLPPNIAELQGPRGVFPLSFGHSVNYVGRRCALIGDSAHRVHPMAGQGVNLGFGDVIQLTDIIVQAARIGSDIGSMAHLVYYEKCRQRHNVPVMGSIHGLHYLYGSTWTPVVVARSVGLSMIDSLPFLKNLIKSRAAI